MPGVSRCGVDTAVGVITGPGVPSVKVNGAPISVVGDVVAAHAPWGRPHPPHDAPTMTGGSPSVKAGGKPVIRAGDTATCGHPATGSGSVSVA
jgi:uncharacterized Zn-binding protein involved in type VI secretion